MSTVFKMPRCEVSWDQGKTWIAGWQQCGPGLLARIVADDGKILWQGRGRTVHVTCTACGGTGQRDEYEFEEVPGALNR
jgi:hypothetical protein